MKVILNYKSFYDAFKLGMVDDGFTPVAKVLFYPLFSAHTILDENGVIQIGKDVVRVLGVPPYISIRINPEMDSILVEPAEEKHKLSFKVAEDICFNKNRQMVISSASFVIGFMVKNNLDISETYQIDGVYSEKNNAAVFQMKDAKVYEPKRKNDYK